MKQIIVCCVLGVFTNIYAEELINEYSVPREYWEYMIGYKYDYKSPQCNVGWNHRAATLTREGEGCGQISAERLRKDVISSISYMKKQGDYSDFEHYYSMLKTRSNYSVFQSREDAISIWRDGCTDYKHGKNLQDFPSAFRIGKIDKLYPDIKRHIVLDLYNLGWKSSLAMNAVINCEYDARIIVSSYLSGMGDIRKTK